MSETPMQKQYKEIKDRYPREILFFRLGDFYEMFGSDALEASKILNITLTARNKGTENEMPMCGVPYHAADAYIAKLTRAGKRVAICEQQGDPSLPGLVTREVIRVVTPGTTIDDKIIDDKSNNFLVCLTLEKDLWGLAVSDMTTGEFQATEIASLELIRGEISRLHPSEVIVSPGLFNDERHKEFVVALPSVNVYQLPLYEDAAKLLASHFKVQGLASFGLQDLPVAVSAAAHLLAYLKETQKTALDHILTCNRYALENFMVLDSATIRNLELFNNAWTFQKEGSLVGVLDLTNTAMGGRTLRRWLMMPLINVYQINQRLAAVAELIGNTRMLAEIIDNLKLMNDFERLLGKIGCGRASARDIVAMKNSLQLSLPIKKLVQFSQSELLKKFALELPDHSELIELVETVLVPDPPLVLNEGGMIKSGYNQELDDLRSVSHSGKEWIAQMQQKEIERTGIHSLKIKFNNVFGYYIEISKSNLDSVPIDYIRKQTLVNAERYITPELKEYEDKVLGAQDRIVAIENQIFLELREKLVKYFADIQAAAKVVGALDVLAAYALLAKKNNYCQPIVNNEGILNIEKGRHPVIEQYVERYVPNDIFLDHEKNEMILLTGPNMSGKSSFLRQIAIATLMAQIGSFVPAAKATIGVVDRIFTRVGASDNLAQGVSTFMNEMQEAANIINNATDKSLIILDEIGRGTSTYDGVSLASAIIEHLHNAIRAKTLFATHFHELIDVANRLERAENYCVAVTENNGQVVFLHQIIRGATSDSYGIEVAKLAGLPKHLTDRAQEILRDLEEKSQRPVEHRPEQTALPLSQKEELLTKELEAVDPDHLTPMQALEKLVDLKGKTNNKNS